MLFRSLLVITVVVASVGIYQLSEFNSRMQQVVNVTAKALENAFKVRNRILQVIRFEKSSVLTTNDGESIRFAELAKGQIKEGNDFRAALSNLLDKSLYNQERALLDEFNRHWDEFQRVQENLLRLSVQNTNSKAWRLIDGELTKKLSEILGISHDIIKSADSEARATEQAKDIGKLMRALRRHQTASRMIEKANKLKLLLIAHNVETEEVDMNKLDSEILQLQEQLRKTLDDIVETVDEKDRGDARRLNGLLQEAFLVGDQIRKYSHTNSTALSTNMSLAEATRSANGCDAAMGKMIESLTGRYEIGRAHV